MVEAWQTTEKSIAHFRGTKRKCDFCSKEIYGNTGGYITTNGDLNRENKDTILCSECWDKHDIDQSLRKIELEKGVKLKRLD